MKYILIKAENIHIINFDDVLEESLSSTRWNRDRTMVVLKCKNNKVPVWYVDSPIYSHESIIKLIQTDEWRI